MSETLDKHYRPTDGETRWYQTWEAEGCFKPEAVADAWHYLHSQPRNCW